MALERTILLQEQVLIPCYYHQGPFDEVQIEVPPPKPFYQPGIYGFLPRKDVRTIDKKPIPPGKIQGRQKGFVVGKVRRFNGDDVEVFINGDLTHSPPIRIPREKLNEYLDPQNLK